MLEMLPEIVQTALRQFLLRRRADPYHHHTRAEVDPQHRTDSGGPGAQAVWGRTSGR